MPASTVVYGDFGRAACALFSGMANIDGRGDVGVRRQARDVVEASRTAGGCGRAVRRQGLLPVAVSWSAASAHIFGEEQLFDLDGCLSAEGVTACW